jgi:large subunit ribosomal protein L18
MKRKIKKLYLQQKKRALKKVVGTTEKPRLAVYRSHKHIYAQIIDDSQGKTLAASSTLKKGLISNEISTASIDASKVIGQTVGKAALEKNITKVVFDRGNRVYHGRIAGVANGAREAGLLF